MASEDSQKRCVDYVTPIPLQKGFHYSLSPYIYLFTCAPHSIFKMNLSILASSPNRCCMGEKCYSSNPAGVSSNPTNSPPAEAQLTGNPKTSPTPSMQEEQGSNPLGLCRAARVML